jgi:transketolase
MRTAFIQELIAQARLHPEIFLIVGDLGYSVVEPFAEEFPDRFLNAGVAEQNMTGVAAGLASEGYHVFTYSIGNFPTLRCLEQIRNDICYHNLPVTIVAVGAGMAYGNLGYSHHSIQDIGCLRGMPNLTILAPGDTTETKSCVEWICNNPSPSYLRLGKAGESNFHSVNVSLDRPLKVIDQNSRVAIAATGSILFNAIEAAKAVALDGLQCDVFSFIRLKPLSGVDFKEFNTYDFIIAVEEHVQAGGIGELIAANLCSKTKVISHCICEDLFDKVGSQEYLRGVARLNSLSIAKSIRNIQSISQITPP